MMSDFLSREPVFAWSAVILALAILPLGVLHGMDGRLVDGIPVWLKPLKFALSLSLYCATLAWFAGWLPDGIRSSGWYGPYVTAVAAAIFIEMAWLCAASALGVRSHFNMDHPVLAALYPVMGLLAVFLTSAALVYGLSIWADGASVLSPAFRLAVALGLILTFVLTVAAAGALATTDGRFGGTPNGPGGPLFGWRLDGGDLRAAHFFATHALHILPLAGWLIARLFPVSVAVPLVWALAALFTGGVVCLMVRAFADKPFPPPLGF